MGELGVTISEKFLFTGFLLPRENPTSLDKGNITVSDEKFLNISVFFNFSLDGERKSFSVDEETSCLQSKVELTKGNFLSSLRVKI
jgi:hypothetical protein